MDRSYYNYSYLKAITLGANSYDRFCRVQCPWGLVVEGLPRDLGGFRGIVDGRRTVTEGLTVDQAMPRGPKSKPELGPGV